MSEYNQMNEKGKTTLNLLLIIVSILVTTLPPSRPVLSDTDVNVMVWVAFVCLLFLLAIIIIVNHLRSSRQISLVSESPGTENLLKMREDCFSFLAKIDLEIESDAVLKMKCYQPSSAVKSRFLTYKKRVDKLYQRYDLVLFFDREYDAVNPAAVAVADEIVAMLLPICDALIDLQKELDNRHFELGDIDRIRSAVHEGLRQLRARVNKSA